MTVELFAVFCLFFCCDEMQILDHLLRNDKRS